MKEFRSILWGLVLIIIGLILGLNALNIVDINVFFDGWWTLLIIIPCFIDLFKDEKKTGNLIGLALGILLLLSCQNVLDFSIMWGLFFPIVLIIVGVSFILKNQLKNATSKKINVKNKKEYCACFSGQKLNFNEEEFSGCDLSAVFGGIDVDLIDSIIKSDIVINATAVFGGIDIIVPKDVNVKINSTSVFGGVDNKVKESKNNKITIYVNTTCLFGGVEIK